MHGGVHGGGLSKPGDLVMVRGQKRTNRCDFAPCRSKLDAPELDEMCLVNSDMNNVCVEGWIREGGPEGVVFETHLWTDDDDVIFAIFDVLHTAVSRDDEDGADSPFADSSLSMYLR